jgi:hypothetical protein
LPRAVYSIFAEALPSGLLESLGSQAAMVRPSLSYSVRVLALRPSELVVAERTQPRRFVSYSVSAVLVESSSVEPALTATVALSSRRRPKRS